MNTVYHVDMSPGNIPYSVYESMLEPDRLTPPAQRKPKFRSLLGGPRTPAPAASALATTKPGEEAETAFNFAPEVKAAVPYVVGDTYAGVYRIIGTTTNLFGTDDETHQKLDADHTIPYRPEDEDGPAQFYEFAEGKCFTPNRFEAVLGSDVARKSDLKMGSKFKATHGEAMPVGTPDIHPEEWVVVGILKPTHTANDACVFIPIMSSYTVEDHALGLKAQWILQHQGQAPPADADPDQVHAYKQNADGTFTLFVPKEYWEVSAILVKTRVFPQKFMYDMNNRHDAMAVSPAQTMQQFFDRFLKPSQITLLIIALMVSIVAAVGILVSIYNSVAARSREIAIIRALGATRRRVLLLICTEAGVIGVVGSLLGLVVAHLAAAVASLYFEKYLGQGIGWYRVALADWYYVAGISVLAVLAGFVPAIKAYSTPVATNLVVN
jgi:putative ABC transport system permease protein